MLIRTHRDAAHTPERAREREDLAIRDAEPLLHRPLADIRDPRRAASPRQMQRSRIPLSSPMSECIYRVRLRQRRATNDYGLALENVRFREPGAKYQNFQVVSYA